MGDFPGFLDFTKPGSGYIDDNRYHPFIRFWKRYGRHFTRLICVNALYALITMPVFVWLMSLINAAAMDMGIGAISVMGTVLLSVVINWPGALLAALLVVSILLTGPATAALSYATLNCAWDRPGMFWAGFWSAWKENWKQALPIGIVDVLVCFGTLYYLVDGSVVFGVYATAVKIVWCVLGHTLCIVMAVLSGKFRGMEADAMTYRAVKYILWELGCVMVSVLLINLTVLVCFDRKGDLRPFIQARTDRPQPRKRNTAKKQNKDRS